MASPSSCDLPPRVLENLADPSKSLGRLLFSKFGTVFDGRRDGRAEYLGTAPSVRALLKAAADRGWNAVQLPNDTPPADRKASGWEGYMGALVYTQSKEFFSGRVSKLDLYNPNHYDETST